MKTFILLTTLFISLQSYNAFACTYRIDEEAKSKELKTVALAYLGDSKITSVVVDSFSFFESKPTAMCPEELTYKAEITVAFSNATSNCVANLKVTKIESWVEDYSNYIVTGANLARCAR